MMEATTRRERGYSLMEILVVVAIIGVLSLVTVPMFINFQRRNAVRTALRSFTTDLRSYRQHAITKNAYVRVQFVSDRDYRALQSRDFGKTWTALRVGTLETADTRTLPQTIAFSSNTYDDSDSPKDGLADVDFRPNGTVGDFATDGTITTGKITLRTEWQDIINQVVVDLSSTGQIKTTESKS